MTADPLLYRDGHLYDQVIRSDMADVAFVRDRVLRRGGPALELCCGTGRLLMPWAAAGCDATGIDASPALLARAREKAAVAGVRVQLLEGDVRRFRLFRQYESIVLAGDSIGHLPDEAALAECLGCVRRHLEKDGEFILDAPVPESRWISGYAEQFHPWARVDVPDDGRLGEFGFRARYDGSARVLSLATEIRFDDGTRISAGTLTLRMWQAAEVLAALSDAGLTPVEHFGNYHGAPPRERSPRCLVISHSSGAGRSDA